MRLRVIAQLSNVIAVVMSMPVTLTVLVHLLQVVLVLGWGVLQALMAQIHMAEVTTQPEHALY